MNEDPLPLSKKDNLSVFLSKKNLYIIPYALRSGQMTVRVSDPDPEPEEVQEGAVAHVLRDDVEWLLLRTHRVHRHQVRVRELLHDFRLLQPTRKTLNLWKH